MTRRSQKTLSDEDRILWNLVARSAVPLKGRAAPVVELVEPSSPPAPKISPSVQALPATQPQAKPLAAPRSLDRPTLNKLAKGRLAIEARVDLHGMTQAEAYSLLFSFISRAHASGVRYVLIITGKGSSSGGDGVLRRSVPGWLATPAFRMFVSSHEQAARHHGGSGALYVRLRKIR
ncbi:Smr/MutS family protein [Aquamicrobium segne]|uniref:Smr/MutS family protein n=1 Tax=Aquamicrobium segne TaxID=469547 RepID=A0ABW0GYM4_9HYPH